MSEPNPPARPAGLSNGHLDPAVAALLRRSGDGLVPAVVQDVASGRVLMMAWMNDEALALTLATGRSTFYSRSRERLWVKGEQSGHRQWVHKVELDCDGDTLLLSVRQEGPACHTGLASCFDTRTLAGTVTDPTKGIPSRE